jgi:hypothetical protein
MTAVTHVFARLAAPGAHRDGARESAQLATGFGRLPGVNAPAKAR